MRTMVPLRQIFRQGWVTALLAVLLLGTSVENASARALLVKAGAQMQALEGSRTASIEARAEVAAYAAVHVLAVPVQGSESLAKAAKDGGVYGAGAHMARLEPPVSSRARALPPDLPLGARRRDLLQVYRC